MHIYRWDLDRTYLATDIRSVRGLVRAAMETAHDKRTIPGAPALLRGLLDYDTAARAEIISGSPTQMRSVLEQKLTLDGIRVEAMVLKDNLDNLRRGRLRALRGQLGYKLPSLLALRLGRGAEVRETLFGDDAEVDALIYTLYAETIAGRLTSEALTTVLEAGGAYPDQIADVRRSMARLQHADAVEAIYIHVDRAVPLRHFDTLGERVHVVFSWFQAALGLFEARRIGGEGVAAVTARCAKDQRLGAVELVALVQDSVRRGVVSADGALDALRAAPPLEPLVAPALRALDLLGPERRVRSGARGDWIGFLRAVEGSDLAPRSNDG